MTTEERFAVWAPAASIWSQWVAPVFFAQIDCAGNEAGTLHIPELSWLSDSDGQTAVVVDVRGASTIELGLALAKRGYRPVPIINASPGPHVMLRLNLEPTSFRNTIVDMGPLLDAVCAATPIVQGLALSPEAAPAFLLDAARLSGTSWGVDEKLFDNRWMVFPQDFPSAIFLKAHGIRQVLLIQQQDCAPQDDLAHVLLRWQEGGIRILGKGVDDEGSPHEISVQRPSRFKAAWYRSLAILGLRRNNAGGFGSYIPETTGLG